MNTQPLWVVSLIMVLLPWSRAVPAADDAPGTPTAADLSRLSIEELADIRVSSVSRRMEALSDAPASVYVITREDIRRAGNSSIPEILRMAPNLQVARLGGNEYAISARGFNSSTANKLLVLIDGRSVYTPLFSGVFWDVQDTLVADIERIEVVSGPGGTLWGSNAVNGVINIITRDARDTRGGLLAASGGTAGGAGALRYGTALGEGSLRLYAKASQRGETRLQNDGGAGDAWHRGQAGFRYDLGGADRGLMLEGEVYDGGTDQPAGGPRSTRGGHVLGRWSRKLAGAGDVQVQASYGRTRRVYPGLFGEVLDTGDVDFQHHFTFRENHDLVWGGGYRFMRDDVENSASLAFLPGRLDLRLANVFVRDSIALHPRLHLNLGAKLEHNDYTGMEFQPDARLAWKLGHQALLWAAVSRAVRTPSRIDRDAFIPGQPPFLLAGGDFHSEKLTAWQLGYRAQPNARLSWSVTGFYNTYDQLRSLEPSAAPGGLPFVIANKMAGHTYGVETWGSFQVREDWRLYAGYTALRKHLHFEPDSRDSRLSAAGNDPPWQFMLRSNMTPTPRLDVDLSLRSVGALPDPAIPGYTVLDGRVGWKASRGVEVSVAGSNLLDRRHVEFAGTPVSRVFGRSLYVKLLWTW